MILIQKNPAPPELEELKKEAEQRKLSDREGYNLLRNPLKGKVRESLMREQGHVCAYCMRKIPDERILSTDTDLSDTYIEHWIPRRKEWIPGDNKGLDYTNLLAVCSGNEKAPETTGRRKRRFFTCDKKREDAELKVNPLDPDTIETIYYQSDGTIRSTDEVIDDDLNVKLNLNCSSEAVTLPQNRKAVLDIIQTTVYEQGDDILQNCIDQLEFWENETDPKTPYIGIGIWWLKDQIQALSGE